MGFSRQEYWSGVPLPSPNHRAVWLYYWALRIDTLLFILIFSYIFNTLQIFFWIEKTWIFSSFSSFPLVLSSPLLTYVQSFLPSGEDCFLLTQKLSSLDVRPICIIRELKLIGMLDMNEWVVFTVMYFSDLTEMCYKLLNVCSRMYLRMNLELLPKDKWEVNKRNNQLIVHLNA